MAIQIKCAEYQTIILSGDDEIKYLNATGNSGTTVSCYDSTNTQYQVPVGKKLILTGMTVMGGNVGTIEIRCYHGSTINSTSGATEWVDDSIRWYYNGDSPVKIPLNVEVPAGDYVTFNFANEQFTVHLMGVLTNA